MFQIDLPAAVVGFAGVHFALRAEAAGIVRAVETGNDRLAVRRSHLLGRVLGNHHEAEDQLLWPALLERDPSLAERVAMLEAEHEELDDRLARLPHALDEAPALAAFLEQHLLAEEQHALPVWLAHFTPEEHEQFGAALRRATPLREAGLMIAWLLDASPDGARELAWQQVPAPLRVAHDLWWRRVYARRWGTHAVAA